jgi:hypothetical protein
VLGLLIGLVLLIGGLAATFYIQPPSWLARELVIRAIFERTGRTLQVNGDTELSWGPEFRIGLGQVELPVASEEAGKPLLSVKRVDIHVEPIDIWRLDFEVPEVALVQPELLLALGDPVLVKFAEGEAGAPGIPKRFIITDGRVVWAGGKSGGPLAVEQINGVATRSAAGKGIAFKGNVVFRGETINVDGALSDLYTLADEGATPMTLKLQTRTAEATLEGQVSTKPIGQFVGTVAAWTDNLPGVLTWARIDPGPVQLGQTGRIEGRIGATLNQLSLDPATLKLDGLSGEVTGQVELDQRRPLIKATMKQALINLNKLFPDAAHPAAFAIEPFEGRLALPTAWTSLKDVLDPVAAPTGGQLGAVMRPVGAWSTQPFKLQHLPDADVTLVLETERIMFRQMPIVGGRLRLKSVPERLDIQLSKLGLYEGTVDGRGSFRLREGQLLAELMLKFSDLAIEPFAFELLKQRLFSGKGNLDLAVAGQGASMRELVGTLNGAATVKATNGAIIGFDLRRAVLAFGRRQSYTPAQRTRFSKIEAVFNLRNGTLETVSPMRLLGNEVDVFANGLVGLVSRRIRHAVQLVVKPPPLHLPIPLRILGTLDAPKISWDIVSAVMQPAQFATPFDVAREARQLGQVPPEIRDAITRVLTSGRIAGGERIAPQVRQFLQELLE